MTGTVTDRMNVLPNKIQNERPINAWCEKRGRRRRTISQCGRKSRPVIVEAVDNRPAVEGNRALEVSSSPLEVAQSSLAGTVDYFRLPEQALQDCSSRPCHQSRTAPSDFEKCLQAQTAGPEALEQGRNKVGLA